MWIGEDKKGYLRRIILNKAIAQCLLGIRINGHPKSILLDSNLAVNLAASSPQSLFKFIKFFYRNDWDIIHNDDVAIESIIFNSNFFIKIIIITAKKKRRKVE